MYWFKDKALAELLRDKKVSQKEQMKYFLIWMLATSLISSGTWNFNTWCISESLTAFDYLTDVTTLLLSIILPVTWYKVNAAGDNEDFIARCVCLLLPISLRAFVVAIPAMIVALAYSLYMDPTWDELASMSDDAEIDAMVLSSSEQVVFYAVLCLLLVYLWRRTNAALRIASGQN